MLLCCVACSCFFVYECSCVVLLQWMMHVLVFLMMMNIRNTIHCCRLWISKVGTTTDHDDHDIMNWCCAHLALDLMKKKDWLLLRAWRVRPGSYYVLCSNVVIDLEV